MTETGGARRDLLAECRAALEPFAAEADRHEGYDDDDYLMRAGGVTVGDLRRARECWLALIRNKP